jgi:arginase
MLDSATAPRDWDLLVSPWHLNEPIENFPVPQGAVTLAGPPDPPASELQQLTGRFRFAADAVSQADHPLMLAGDCLTSLGLVTGLQRRHRGIGVIWLDAHGDFNTPAISPSGYLAGMSLAMLTGRAPELITEGLGLRSVPDERVVLIDARDLDPAERDALAASGVRRLPADPSAVRDWLTDVPADRVYLHLDVDVIDAGDLPGLRFPTGGGPSFSVVKDCLEQIVAVAPPIAACIACAWSADRMADEATRRSIAQLAAVIGAKLQWLPSLGDRGFR